MNYTFDGQVPVGPWEFALYKDCNNGLLVKKDSECPISSAKLVENELEVHRVGPFLKPMMIDLEFSLNEPRCFRSYARPARNMPQGAPKDYPFLFQPNTGCADSLDDDYAELLGRYLEKEFYQANQIYTNFSSNFFLYEYFLTMPGNLLNLYTYHSFGFRFVNSS